MNFVEHLRKSDVSENSKVYYGRFVRNGLHKGKAILVQLLKVYEMCNILKSVSHCLLAESSRLNWMINVFASFIKGKASFL